jgi:urease accessory protein
MSSSDLCPGAGELRFSQVQDRTVVTRALAVSPLKLLNPRNAGRSAWAYLATYGGGLLGGDALSLRVTVDSGASALIATQASTKVYRSQLPASQQLQARVSNDSLLVVLPDPVTCFSGSRYEQAQHLRLGATANLVLVDWLTAGRVGSGERWRFDEYSTRTFVWRDTCGPEVLLLHDALKLTPDDGDLASRLGRFNCLALAVLVGPALRATAVRLAGSLGSAPSPRRAGMLMSAAPLGDDGVILRVAGRSAEEVGAALRQHLSVVTSLLGDDPWSCRW